jgi:hypothetical protein
MTIYALRGLIHFAGAAGLTEPDRLIHVLGHVVSLRQSHAGWNCDGYDECKKRPSRSPANSTAEFQSFAPHFVPPAGGPGPAAGAVPLAAGGGLFNKFWYVPSPRSTYALHPVGSMNGFVSGFFSVASCF